MAVLHGFKFQMCVPVADEDGNPFDIATWTWWRDEILRLVKVLNDSEGPWTTRSERYRWLDWTVRSEEQLNVLLHFARETRATFGIEAIYADHYPITFHIITETTKWPNSS